VQSAQKSKPVSDGPKSVSDGQKAVSDEPKSVSDGRDDEADYPKPDPCEKGMSRRYVGYSW